MLIESGKPMMDKNSFRNLSLFGKISTIFGLGLLITLALCIFFALIFLGVKGFFAIFDVSYQSNTTILWFILLLALVDLFFDFMKFIVKYLLSLFRFQPKQLFILLFLLYFQLNVLIIFLIDGWMDSLQMTTIAQFVAALFITCIELAFSDQFGKKSYPSSKN